jgi:hypothetical protein
VHRTEPAQLYFKTGPRPCWHKRAQPTRSLACTCAPGCRSDHAPFRPRTDNDCQRCISNAPVVAPTRATCLPASTRHTCSHHPMCSASNRHSGTGDSYVAATATSRRRCQPAATSTPRATHAAAAPCVTRSTHDT